MAAATNLNTVMIILSNHRQLLCICSRELNYPATAPPKPQRAVVTQLVREQLPGYPGRTLTAWRNNTGDPQIKLQCQLLLNLSTAYQSFLVLHF